MHDDFHFVKSSHLNNILTFSFAVFGFLENWCLIFIWLFKVLKTWSIDFQVFNIFFTFRFWKPNIEACSIGFPVIGNKICFLGAPVRNQYVNVILFGHNIRFNIKKYRKVTGFVSELASYIGEDEATWKWQSFALSNKTRENYFCLLQFQNNLICILSFLYYQ